MKRYPLHLGVMVYNEGDSRILPALEEAKAFIEAGSKFKVKLKLAKGGESQPSPSVTQPPSFLLGPGDVDMTKIRNNFRPETGIILLTWACGDLPQCPALSGATWPIWEWIPGQDWQVALISIAYKKSVDTSWVIWEPDKDTRKGEDGMPTQVFTGYSNGYVTTLINELCLALFFWLKEIEFNIIWPYDLKQEDYPNCKAQDRAWLALITDEMYEAFVGPGEEEDYDWRLFRKDLMVFRDSLAQLISRVETLITKE